MGSPAIIPNNTEYNTQDSPPVDPFLKPHELDRAPSKHADDIPIDPNIPDISTWNTADVYDYFKEHHPEAAPILKDQVIILLY